MSKLSDLLNPVPSSHPASPLPRQQASPTRSQISSSEEATPAQVQPLDELEGDSQDLKGSNSNHDLNKLEEMAAAHPTRVISASGTSESPRPQNSPPRASTSFMDIPPPAGTQLPRPVEPSPPTEREPHAISPTLDQYHHGSGSPTQGRRRSSFKSSSPPTKLAPIQSLPDPSQEPHRSASPSDQAQRVGQGELDSRNSMETHKQAGPYAPDAKGHGVKSQDPGGVWDEIKSSQAHDPSPGPPPSAHYYSMPSPHTQIKTEPSGTSREPTPATPIVAALVEKPSVRATSAIPTTDAPTPREVTSLRENSIKAPSTEGSTSPRGTPSSVVPKATAKKRAAPKSGSAKKGTAAALKKPQNKKRKVDKDSKDGTPFSKHSPTPPSSRASKTPANRNPKPSVTPALEHSSPAAADEDFEDSAELFCICRRPDNHTWMIGCDGGCEDWFHGACVNIKEVDGDLIDKYICPTCESEGKGNTTWKPMCRLDGCRQPARLAKKNASKYCSDEHGREFMEQRIRRGTKRKRSSKTQKDEGDAPAVGGTLSTSQLSAVTKDAKDVEAFKSLGEGVLSPPPTISPDEDGDKDIKMDVDDVEPKGRSSFNKEERDKIEEISKEKDRLMHRRHGLKDREKFVQLVRSRAKRILEELKGVKDLCGYDSRLSWTEEEFLAWRDSDEGCEALKNNTLGPPPADTADDAEEDENSKGVCQKKRCERHKQWWTIQLQDIRFEDVNITEELERLRRDEQDLKDRAKLRRIKEAEGDRDGRVELVA
ncbi:MAG: hypothetical protein M1837_004044 [Sclerophora amabilis]|nr:MAG: hypothetical protein M1837_004044 [Sclerophora amabilis]